MTGQQIGTLGSDSQRVGSNFHAGTTPSTGGQLAGRVRLEPPYLNFRRDSGRFANLRPVSRKDYPFLYALITDEEVGPRWRFRGVIPREDQLEAALWEGVLGQFVVTGPKTTAPIGLACIYNASIPSGYANIGVVLKRSSRLAGAGVDAVRLLAAHSFQTWPFRKLYLEVPEFNLPQFASAIGRYLHEEGRLRAHDYLAGRYWDAHLLALYPEDLEKFQIDFAALYA
ncbi:MAG: GNAT family N-acetyltransferase [Acidimicrobiales bacterium]